MEKLKLNGVIAAAEFKGAGKTGWKNWNAQFADGSRKKLVIGPNDDFELKAGDQVSCVEGKFESFIVQSVNSSGGGSTPSKGKGSKSSGGGSSMAQSGDYWQKKFDYEKNQRDAQIAIQATATIIQPFYYQKFSKITKPTDENVNEAVDALMEKARSIAVDNVATARLASEFAAENEAKAPKKEKKAKKVKKKKEAPAEEEGVLV